MSLIGAAAIADHSPDRASALLEEVIAARRSIPGGRVRLRLSHEVVPKKMASYRNVVRLYSISFTEDGQFHKTVLDWTNPGKAEWIAGTLRTPSDVIKEPGSWALYARRSSSPTDDRLTTSTFDPRIIGLRAQRLTQLRPGTQLTSEDVFWFATISPEPGMLDEVTLQGTPHVRLTFSPRETQRATMWISPEMDNAVSRIEIEELRFGFKSIVESKYKRTPVDDGEARTVWFPYSVTYSETEAEDIVYRELVLVEDVDFGITFSEDEFSVASLNLDVGRRILLDGVREQFWDGKQIRNATTREPLNAEGTHYYVSDAALSAAPSTRRSIGATLLVANAALATCVLLAMAVRRMRGRFNGEAK